MIRRSVTIRLMLSVVALEAVLVATLAVTAYSASKNYFTQQFDTALTARAEVVAAELEVRADGTLVLQEPHRPINRKVPGSRRPDLFRVWTDSGQVATQSEELPRQLISPWITEVRAPRPGRPEIFDATWNDRPYRAVWAVFEVAPEWHPATMPAGPPRFCNVLLAVSRRSLDDMTDDLVDFLLGLSAVLMVVTAVVTAALVRWGLRPVRRAARDMEKITSANIGLQPVGTPNPPPEIRPFIDVLNAMLVRLGRAFRQQRRFTANASHELRTPMAVIKSTIQGALLHERSAGEYRDALIEVQEDLTDMEQTVEQLLLLARLDEEGLPGPLSRVNLDDMLVELVGRHQGDADRAGVRLDLPQAAGAWITGNPMLLELLFANLLVNGIRHNRPGGEVSIRTRTRDGWATVEVADTGPGIPPEALEHIFERFYRADRSRSRQRNHGPPSKPGPGGGSGLGLAIVREIAERHGGTVTAANRPAGGAVFRVRLPAGDASAG